MSTSPGHDDVVPVPGRTRRGSAVAATALAAVLLMGIGLGPAAATADEMAPQPRPGTGVSATERIDPEVAQRLVGVAQDLAEAVTHGEITAEQAEKFLRQVCARLAR